MFLRQNVHRVLIKKNFLRIIIKKYFYATTMRPRIHYTQQSSSWRRVARIVSANRMLRDRTLSIALSRKTNFFPGWWKMLKFWQIVSYGISSILVYQNFEIRSLSDFMVLSVIFFEKLSTY